MLTNKQLKHLRSLAHPLNFVIQTGDKGLTQEVQAEIKIALKSHELIKVKLNADREQRDVMITDITTLQKCEVVQYIGKTVVLFKRNSNAIKIDLPKI